MRARQLANCLAATAPVVFVTRRDMARVRKEGIQRRQTEIAEANARFAERDAKIDNALARLGESIDRSREFWAEQEAARNADSWEAAWGTTTAHAAKGGI